MKISTAIVAFTAVASSTVHADGNLRAGGFFPTTVTPYHKDILVSALGDMKNYSPSVYKPICVKDVVAVKQQIVNGMNYMYEVQGCGISPNDILGECGERDCVLANFEVLVYSQPWTKTLQVQNINWLD